MGGLPRRLDSSHHYEAVGAPQYPSRQQSQHYQSANTHPDSQQQQQQQQQQHGRGHHGLTTEEYEEMEDRRRMQQQILRDKLVQADSSRKPDPNMTVKMTTNTGFALGAFDMSESLAIVEDLLDYFGEDDLANYDYEGEGEEALAFTPFPHNIPSPFSFCLPVFHAVCVSTYNRTL